MAIHCSAELSEVLFEHIRKKEWHQVVEQHKRNPMAFRTEIDVYRGNTALLMAISGGERDVVKELVGQINRKGSEAAKETLRFGNKKRRTALHVAAATGDTEMCRLIGEVDDSLVLVRDYQEETPLFSAVRYGRRGAFLYLQSLAARHHKRPFASRRYCWNKSDQTILQNAIIREHFDLAFQIIDMYKELVNVVDKERMSPLHALARKPAAFESGSSLRGWVDKIIYNYISIEKLEKKGVENSDLEQGVKDKRNLLENKRNNFLNFLLGGSHHGKKEFKDANIESGGGRIDQTGSNTTDQEDRSFWCAGTRSYDKLLLRICLFFNGDMSKIEKIKEEKEKRVWAGQVLDALLEHATLCDGKKCITPSEKVEVEKLMSGNTGTSSAINQSADDGSETNNGEDEDKNEPPQKKIMKESALLVAAKYGIAEIVEIILQRFPMAIYDKDTHNKNIVLIVLENRHKKILEFLLRKYGRNHIAFLKVDEEGNTALHHAAMYEEGRDRPWPVPGAALQLQQEIKWLEYVERVMPRPLYLRTNKQGQTSKEKFSETHKDLVKSGGQWLTDTATSCSVVAALIAGVAFASSTTTPGGTVKKNFTYDLFAISSLVSLCFSVTSLVMFLAILTSRREEKDFGKSLPRKILFGLTSLFVSIASVLVTFCTGHFLLFKDNFEYFMFPVYGVTFLPLCLFAAAQFPLYYDLMEAIV